MESARNKELIGAHLPPSKSSRWVRAHTHTQRCDEVRLVGFGVRSQRKKEVLAALLKEEEKNTGNEKREKKGRPFNSNRSRSGSHIRI